MKRANIYDAESKIYISYLNIIDQLNGRFDIFDSNNDNLIAYGNIKDSSMMIYDITTDEYIEYGSLNGNNFNLYDSKTNKLIKYGSFI